MKNCPECGNYFEKDVKFCPECGYKIQNNDKPSIKLSSEEYIKKSLSEIKESRISISPDIPNKKLLAAASIIGKGIDPAIIIALWDTSLFSNGKSGAIFTGSEAYLKEMLGKSYCIKYEGLTDVRYELETKFDTNGKEKNIKHLIVVHEDEEQDITSSDLSTDFPFEKIAEILAGTIDNIEEYGAKDQIVQLTNLDPKIIELYFRVVMAYLRLDDDIIDPREYKELTSLMAKVKVSKEVASLLREYRFSEQREDIDLLIFDLKKELDVKNISRNAVYQSLGIDILSMNENYSENWQENQLLTEVLKKLYLDEKQVIFAIRKIEMDKKIIEERMTDNQIKDVLTELTALATVAGISVGALAITGGISTGVSGGLLALAAGSGGTLAGVALVAAGAYGAYRGIKYFAGTSELEKYGIRIDALLQRIKLNQVSTTYMIEDVNWLGEQINEFVEKLRESEEFDEELLKELEYLTSLNQSVSQSAVLVEDDQDYSEVEYLIAKLPKKIEIGKLNELLSNNINKVRYEEIIKAIYRLENDEEESNDDSNNDSNQNILILNEFASKNQLEIVYSIFEEIGFYSLGSSSIAQSKSMAKQGINSLKKSLFGGE